MARAQGSGAGALVAQLLAFLREPARERPRYTSGREPIPAGDHILRFAQGRFEPQVLARTTPAERLELRDAAQAFIRQVCFWDNATHYQVLCAPPGASRAALKENYRLLMALIHPDRRDADSAAWPRDCAQRVNRAYEILADERSRREYDATLDRRRAAQAATSTGGFAVPHVGARRPVRWTRRVAVAGLALGVLAVALAAFEWIFTDHPQERLAGLWTGKRSSEQVGTERPPRYINSPHVDAKQVPLTEKAPFELPVLTPLWRAITGTERAHEDTRAPGSKMPPAAVPPPPAESAPTAIAPASVVAQVPGEPSPVEVAPAPAKAPAPVAAAALPGLPARDIEVLVVRLVDSYEAGDVDRLMALVDPDGFWATTVMRQSYANFFRATRARRLHVTNLDWRNADHEAHARGQALLRAEYDDDRGVVERNVDVEMDIAMRDGRARIVRLKLYPNAS